MLHSILMTLESLKKEASEAIRHIPLGNMRDVQILIQEATLVERKRCAEVARKTGYELGYDNQTGDDIAAAIEEGE